MCLQLHLGDNCSSSYLGYGITRLSLIVVYVNNELVVFTHAAINLVIVTTRFMCPMSTWHSYITYPSNNLIMSFSDPLWLAITLADNCSHNICWHSIYVSRRWGGITTTGVGVPWNDIWPTLCGEVDYVTGIKPMDHSLYEGLSRVCLWKQ